MFLYTWGLCFDKEVKDGFLVTRRPFSNMRIPRQPYGKNAALSITSKERFVHQCLLRIFREQDVCGALIARLQEPCATSRVKKVVIRNAKVYIFYPSSTFSETSFPERKKAMNAERFYVDEVYTSFIMQHWEQPVLSLKTLVCRYLFFCTRLFYTLS